MAIKRTKSKSGKSASSAGRGRAGARSGAGAGKGSKKGSKKKSRVRSKGTSSNSAWAKAGKGSTKKSAAGSGKGNFKGKARRPKRSDPNDTTLRLQRVMAAAGIGSRRECETIIEEGRVEVDGKIVVELGTKVDPNKQKIKVDGSELKRERLQYFILNKPQGVLSTSSDPSGRIRVIDLIQTTQRVYNVGRLDQSSEGLILVTNDGTLAHRLTHPRFGIEKVYHVQVIGRPEPGDLKTLVDGVYLAEGKAQATSAKFIRKGKESSWIEITLTEGRNREIRRLLAKIGHKVRVLKRVAIGPLKLKDLPTGAHRELSGSELKALIKATSGKPPQRKKSVSRGKAKGIDEVHAEQNARREELEKKKPSRRKSPVKKSVTRPAPGGRGRATSVKGKRKQTNPNRRRK
jgi:23S rRNA pseudouridine2605 synthase